MSGVCKDLQNLYVKLLDNLTQDTDEVTARSIRSIKLSRRCQEYVFCIRKSFSSSLSSLKPRSTFANLCTQHTQLRISQHCTTDHHHERDWRAVRHPEVGEAGASGIDVLCERKATGVA
jgi:hypothetical protein